MCYKSDLFDSLQQPKCFCSIPPLLCAPITCFDGYLNYLRRSFGNRLFIPVWAQLALYRPIQHTLQITVICWQFLLLCAVLLLASAGYQQVFFFVLSCCVLLHTRWRCICKTKSIRRSKQSNFPDAHMYDIINYKCKCFPRAHSSCRSSLLTHMNKQSMFSYVCVRHSGMVVSTSWGLS